MDPHPSTRFQALVDAFVRKTTRLTSFFEAVGRTTRLNALVAALDRKFGPKALRRLRRTVRDIECVSTGFPCLQRYNFGSCGNLMIRFGAVKIWGNVVLLLETSD